ncbi:MAG TPA: BTAD domain-containing putative transcriptional regulator [Acidimicrobiia bacterium]
MTTDGLAIRVLGDVDIRVGGRPIEVDTRKALALLTYLAVSGTSASRDTLTALLWSDLDSNRGRGALRRTLSVLRKALGNRWLAVDSDRVRLETDAVYLDLEDARRLEETVEAHHEQSSELCLECLRCLERAASLYRGEFMAGFYVRDAPEFESWQLHEADRVRRRHTSVLARLADAVAARGDFARSVDIARQRVAVTPLDEAAHRQLMTALVWAGDRAAALRQYKDLVRVLDEELGVPPLPETSALEERILLDDIPEPPFVASSPSSGRQTEPPPPSDLVGREKEIATLKRLAEGEGGRVAVIVGPPGIGKSRLAREIAEWARARSLIVAESRAYEGEERLGLVVIGEALRAALDEWDSPPPLDPVAAAEASRLVPGLEGAGGQPPPPDPGGQTRFVDGVCRALSTLLGENGLLILDDLQWADEASNDLIAYLIRRGDRFPFFRLLIWRTPPSGRHPLTALVEQQVASGRGAMIELGPLPPEDAERLARSSRPDLPADVAAQVVEEGEGNPFLTLHLLQTIDPDTGLLPATRQSETAEIRLRGVSDLGRQILAAASIIGRAFDPFDVRAASGRSDEETALGLEELVAAGIVTERGDGMFDFSHDIVRQHVRDSLTAVRRRLLHDRLADHLLRLHGSNDAHAGRVAHHLEEAGRLEEAARFHARAGDHARSVYAHQEALAHYEAALALGYPDVVTVQMAIGDLQTLIGDYTAALDSYRTAAARADGEDLALLEHRLGVVNARLGRWDMAIHHYRTAAEGLTDFDDLLATYVDWARAARGSGDDAGARQAVAEAAKLAEASGGQPPIVAIMEGLLSEDPDAGEARALEGLELARAAGDPMAQLAGLTTLAQLARRRGDHPTALERIDAALRLVSQIGDRHREAALHDLAADLHHEMGDEDKAMEQLRQAAALFAEVGTGDLEPAIWKITPW